MIVSSFTVWWGATMDDLDSIHGAYKVINTNLSALSIPQGISNENRLEYYKMLKEYEEINSHAYFCLAFAQCEDLIKKRFRQLVGTCRTTTRGADQGAWEYVGGNKIDILFMVKFLLPGHDKIYATVRELYRDRNHIVHEAKLTLPIDLPRVIKDIKDIAKLIDDTLSTPEAAL